MKKKELEAEVERLENNLSGLLYDLTGGFLSKTNYSVSTMVTAVEESFHEAYLDDIAEAWDEGYTSGHSNAMRRMSDEPNAPTTPNPYRAILGAEAGDAK